MRKPSIARISIATVTAGLCLAVASPAMACIPAESSGWTQSADPLSAAIAKADSTIANEQHQLDGWAARFIADQNLTTAQRNAFAGAIATARADLQAQQAQIDAAVSLADVTADLQSPTVDAANAAVGLDLAIASANDALVSKANGLAALLAKVAADGGLSAAQKVDVDGVIAVAQTQIQDARSAVNAATTTAAVTAAQSGALRAALNAVSLRLAIDHADSQIDAAQAKLADWLSQVVADPSLTDQQKTDATTRITAVQASLTALRTNVDAATSAGQVASLLEAAHFGDQPWKGDDPAKLSRSDRHELAVVKRGASCGQNNPGAVSANPPVVTAVITTNNTGHQQDPKAPAVSTNASKSSTSHNDHRSPSGSRGSRGHRH
jgi:hypothetical protein